MSEYENETFRKAARDAGIKGRDWSGTEAIKAFSTYYHDNYPRHVRIDHGYPGVRKAADSWWSDNKSKYS